MSIVLLTSVREIKFYLFHFRCKIKRCLHSRDYLDIHDKCRNDHTQILVENRNIYISKSDIYMVEAELMRTLNEFPLRIFITDTDTTVELMKFDKDAVNYCINLYDMSIKSYMKKDIGSILTKEVMHNMTHGRVAELMLLKKFRDAIVRLTVLSDKASDEGFMYLALTIVGFCASLCIAHMVIKKIQSA